MINGDPSSILLWIPVQTVGNKFFSIFGDSFEQFRGEVELS